jgi:hypothetical protein
MGIIGGGKTVPEQLLVHDISGMFEMGTGRVLAEEFVGAASVLSPSLTEYFNIFC